MPCIFQVMCIYNERIRFSSSAHDFCAPNSSPVYLMVPCSPLSTDDTSQDASTGTHRCSDQIEKRPDIASQSKTNGARAVASQERPPAQPKASLPYILLPSGSMYVARVLLRARSGKIRLPPQSALPSAQHTQRQCHPSLPDDAAVFMHRGKTQQPPEASNGNHRKNRSITNRLV